MEKEENFNNKHDYQINPNSTWLNPGIKSLKQLKDWILTKLGFPLITVELTDEQLDSCIGDAISIYSKYSYTPERYLILNLKYYKPNFGLDLTQFRVMSIKSISYQRDSVLGYGMDPFFSPYTYFGQGQGGPFFGMGNANSVGMFTTFHNLNEWFQMAERLTGSNPDYCYDKFTKILKLMPEPYGQAHDQYILAICNCEPPMEEYYGNEYVRRLALGYCKQLLGTVRSKFSNLQLIGGGVINTDIGNEGKEEVQQLLDELIKTESKGQYFCLS